MLPIPGPSTLPPDLLPGEADSNGMEDMMSSSTLMQRVVVGIDGTPDGLAAAEYAVGLTPRRNTALVLLHAYRRTPALNPLLPAVDADPVLTGSAATAVAYRPYASGFSVDLMRDAGARALEAVREHLDARFPALAVEMDLVAGSPARALLHESRTAYAVVVGRNHERSAERFFTGSTSSAVATHADCPVVVVPTNWRDLPETGRVVVGLDAGRQEHEVLTFAFEQAQHRAAQLVVLHSAEASDYWDPPFEGRPADHFDLHGGRRAVSEALAGWATLYPDVAVTTSFSEATSPAQALVRASDSADLVVVGARGQGGFRGLLLGSTARSVVRHASSPVAVVRHRASTGH